MINLLEFKSWIINEELYWTGVYDGFIRNTFQRGIEYNTYKNPNMFELKKVLQQERNLGDENPDRSAAGIFTHQGDIFIWPRSFSTHGIISHKLKIKIHLSFYVGQDLIVRIGRPGIKGIPENFLIHPFIKMLSTAAKNSGTLKHGLKI